MLTGNKESRSYQVSGEKLKQQLGFVPQLKVKDAVEEIWQILAADKYTDFANPIYYNIEWMKLLVEIEQQLKIIGKVF